MSDYRLWDSPKDELALPVLEPVFCCSPATDFALFLEQLTARLFPAGQPPTSDRINHALAVLSRRYWDARQLLPKSHRDRVADRSDHPCVYGLYLEALERIMTLTLLEPPAAIPRPPRQKRPPERPRLFGLTLETLEHEP